MRLKRNNRGSILIITVAFVLAFTLIGIAAISFATMQNELAEKRKASAMAFWLADGALDFARKKLPTPTSELNKSIEGASGEYDVVSSPEYARDAAGNILKKEDGSFEYTFKYQWTVDTTGIVNGERRSIHAVYQGFNMPDRKPLQYKDPKGNPFEIDENLTEQDEDLSFETVLHTTESIIKDTKRWEDINQYINLSDIDHESTNFFFVTVHETQNFEITGKNAASKFMIVDARPANGVGRTPRIRFTDKPKLRGILWIIGNAELVDTNVEGLIFVDGVPRLVGDNKASYDSRAVDEALRNLKVDAGEPKILAWKEI